MFDNGIFEALLHIDNVSIRISCFKHWLLEQQWDILTLIEISFFVNIFLFSFLSSCQALTWDGLWSHCWEQSNKNIFMNIIAQDQTHLSHLTKSNIISYTRINEKEEKRIKYKIRIILDNVFILPSRGTFYVSAKWKRWSR